MKNNLEKYEPALKLFLCELARQLERHGHKDECNAVMSEINKQFLMFAENMIKRDCLTSVLVVCAKRAIRLWGKRSAQEVDDCIESVICDRVKACLLEDYLTSLCDKT